jgi:EsV-1-7 cysteine-rich motif
MKNKTCQHEGCSKRPIYNNPGETVGLYCKGHMKIGMVDVKNKKCQYEGGCNKQPCFNKPGETVGIYCKKHREDGMEDVVSKKCQFEECKKQATYGLIGDEPSRCAVHANKRIEILRPTRRCKKKSCHELATHGDKHPVYCELHSQPEDISFIISKCSNCHLEAIVDKEGHCYTCVPERIEKVRLAKQKKVTDYLSHYMEFVSVDSVIDSRIGLERPDIVINPESENFKIVVEVDEGQHKSYPEFCECVRMKNVSEMFRIPTLIIRYNPDEYNTPDEDEVPEKKRLIRLKQVIDFYMKMERLQCAIGIIQLYFDGWIENMPVNITTLEELNS